MLDQQKDAIQNLIVRALAALDVADVVPQLENPKIRHTEMLPVP